MKEVMTLEHTLTICLSVLPAIATGVIGYLLHKLKKHEEEKEAETERWQKEQQTESKATRMLMIALAHDRILQGYRYYRRQGGISTQDLETIEKLYTAYHALGGNGTVTRVYEKILALPIKEE